MRQFCAPPLINLGTFWPTLHQGPTLAKMICELVRKYVEIREKFGAHLKNNS